MIEDPTADHLSIRHFSLANGLASDEIQALTEDNSGRIYAGTGLGVDRINPATGQIAHFSSTDGLAEGEVQDAVRDAAGDLWFGTYKGVSRFHPRLSDIANSSPTRISSIKVNGRIQTTALGSQDVKLPDLPPGSNGVEIEFLALATSGPNNVQYEYQLEHGKAPWSAPTAARTVVLNNLRAGTYTFRVRTVGAATGEEALVHFTVQPHFWETWPFLLLTAGISLAMMYALRPFQSGRDSEGPLPSAQRRGCPCDEITIGRCRDVSPCPVGFIARSAFSDCRRTVHAYGNRSQGFRREVRDSR
jgi:hypothetical protein